MFNKAIRPRQAGRREPVSLAAPPCLHRASDEYGQGRNEFQLEEPSAPRPLRPECPQADDPPRAGASGMTQTAVVSGPEQDPILIVDDIPSLRAIYQAYLGDAGFHSITARSAREAREKFRESEARVVLLDMFLPDSDGLELMREFIALRPATAVVMVTADRSIERAVAAIRAGAQDFLVKPVTSDRLVAAIRNARAAVLAADPSNRPEEDMPVGELIAFSPLMRELGTRLRMAAASSAPVYIWGEASTGKHLCAQMIHDLSDRAAGPFIVLDGTALTAEEFAPALLGRSLQDARRSTMPWGGAAAQARGGTLFLSNIHTLPPEAHGLLAHFLSQAVPQWTDPRLLPPDMRVRVICSATTPPLDANHLGALAPAMLSATISLRMPALRERREDIVPLAETLLARFSTQAGRPIGRLTPATAAILRALDWPGNVRQMTEVLRGIAEAHPGQPVTPDMLPADLHPHAERSPPGTADLSVFAGMPLARVERLLIEASLRRHDGYVPDVARELGLSPSTVYRKISQWRAGED
ncbi:sigma-54-dependent Fis family transcriptional regulator [Sinirhodobacter populi]|nr:sigma-54-dependent Fis family transcriptional regulator [Sinirhodobacter populi]